MLYCYFIARSKPEIESLSYRTLQDAPILFVRYQELAAAGRWLPAGTRSTPELLLEHAGVLATASKRVAVLPLRFGTSFRTESAVVHLLADRGPELLAALDRLDGKAEMGLRVPLAAGEDAQSRAAEIAEIGRPLDIWAESGPRPAGPAVLELAHLIDRRDADAYRQRVQPYALDVAGPRYPFHFLPRFLRMPVRTERRSTRARSATAG